VLFLLNFSPFSSNTVPCGSPIAVVLPSKRMENKQTIQGTELMESKEGELRNDPEKETSASDWRTSRRGEKSKA